MTEQKEPRFSDDLLVESQRFRWGVLRTILLASLSLGLFSLVSHIDSLHLQSCLYPVLGYGGTFMVGISGFEAVLHGFAAQGGRTWGRRGD